MAGVKFEKGSMEWCMFRDYWAICQKFWIPEDNEEYWDAVVRETDEFYKKYKEIPLTNEITLAFVELLDKLNKDKLKKRGET